jgi:hypothetical protein
MKIFLLEVKDATKENPSFHILDVEAFCELGTQQFTIPCFTTLSPCCTDNSEKLLDIILIINSVIIQF